MEDLRPTSSASGNPRRPEVRSPPDDDAPLPYDETYYVEGEFLEPPPVDAPSYRSVRRDEQLYDENYGGFDNYVRENDAAVEDYSPAELRNRGGPVKPIYKSGSGATGGLRDDGCSGGAEPSQEWDATGIVASARNFKQDVRVFMSFTPNDFANTLMLSTLVLGLVAIGRGLTSFIATVTNVEINMVHLHIADVGILVFGVFMLMTMIMFFYVYDYSDTTYQHKLTVMKPYAAAVFFYGAGVIALWTFTRDHGEFVDYNDAVEILRYKITHLFFTMGSILVLIFIPDAIFAHKHPEAETEDKFFLVPSEAHR